MTRKLAFFVVCLACLPRPSFAQTKSATAPAPQDGCNDDQRAKINAARQKAFGRSQKSVERMEGLLPPPPPGRTDFVAAGYKAQAKRLAKKMFLKDLDMDGVAGVVEAMRNNLASPSLPVVCAASTDTACGFRTGYVVNNQAPIHLCPEFFKDSDEQQARTMAHEAAHLAKIGDSSNQVEGSEYCIMFDCDTACGKDEQVADSWSQFVYCMSGQPPDQPMVITGSTSTKKSSP